MYGDTRTGLVVLLGHLAALLGAGLLLLVHVGLGARVRRALGANRSADATWRWPVDASLGAGTLALVLLAVGTAGFLRPAVTIGVTLALAVVARSEIRTAAREFTRMLHGGRAVGDVALRDPDTVPRALVAVLLLLLIAAAVAPPTDWDSLMYHLRIPRWFLDQGRIALPADSFHVALVGGAHLATLPLLAAGLLTGPALMQVAALALAVMGTLALARAVGATRASGWLAVAVVFGSPMFVLVAITARVDVSLVVTLLAAHLALLTAEDGDDPRALTVAALLVGSAMAIKPQAGAYAVMLIPLGWRAARGMRPALGAALLAAVVCAPWFLKNQILVGAALYPKGAPGRFEPWIADLFGGQVRPGWVDASVLRALPEARAAFNVLDAFLAPGKLTIEKEGIFYALSPLLLLLPLVVFAWRARRRAVGLALVGLGYAALVVIPFGQVNLRYLMPAIPAVAVALVAALEEVSAWAGARIGGAMRRTLGVALAATALLPLTGALRQRFFAGDRVLLRHAIGLVSAQEVWHLHPDFTVRAFAPVLANVRRIVPADGKILMLWEARGLPFGREVLVDVMLSNWSYLAQSRALADCLAGTGITHILANKGAVGYYVSRGADPQAFLLDRFRAFRERCVTSHEVVGPGFDLLVVRTPPR